MCFWKEEAIKQTCFALSYEKSLFVPIYVLLDARCCIDRAARYQTDRIRCKLCLTSARDISQTRPTQIASKSTDFFLLLQFMPVFPSFGSQLTLPGCWFQTIQTEVLHSEKLLVPVVFKASLHGEKLSNLVYCKVSLPMAGWLKLEDL